MTVPLLIRSTSDLLYNYSLSSAYRSAWVYDPDFALAKEPDIWEIVRRDAVIAALIAQRTCAVAGRDWHVEPGGKADEDKKLAAVIEDILKQIELFNDSRHMLAQAPLLGRTYLYIEGGTEPLKLDDLPEMEWWVPKRLRHVDRRRFHWVADWSPGPKGQQNLSTHLEMFSLTQGRWVKLDHPEYFIRYTYSDSEDRLGYGRPLLEAAYFYHYMKTQTFEKVAQGIDRWANGILVGKLDDLRNASTGKTNEDLRKGMRTVLQTMRSEHIVVLQKGDEIEVVESSGGGQNMAMEFIKYLDEGLARLFCGSALPFGGGGESTGSYARAETESDVSEATVFQPERELLDQVITRDLVGLILRLNVVNFAKLGLAGARKPKIQSAQEKREDPNTAVDRIIKLKQAGVPIMREEIYHKAGLTMPTENDDVLEGDAAFSLENVPLGSNNAGGEDQGRPIQRPSPMDRGRGTEPKKV